MENSELFAFESHETALCAIPPQELWSSVDSLRSLYDKAYAAWPPHINIIYPFVRPEVLEQAAQILQGNEIEHRPQVVLDTADSFNHKHHNTIFLGQSSKQNIKQLSDLKNHISHALGQPQNATEENFTPHMTIGQSEDAEAAPHHFLLEKARVLTPITWELKEVSILVREPLAQSGTGPRPMKLWGTLNLESGKFSQITPPRDFNDRLEDMSRISFQPSHCFSPVPTPDTTEVVLDRLVVTSYNVLAEFEWPPQSHRHAPLVQSLLSPQAAADIVVLEEVTDHFLPDLLGSQELRDRYPFVSHKPPGDAGAGPLPSLLNIVVLSKFPFEWHHLSFQRKHKGCAVVRFPTIGTRETSDGEFKSWVLVACHLSQGLTDGAIATKKNEVQKMLDYLFTTFPQNPWILAGDFNIVTSSFTMESARKRQDISSQSAHRLRDIDRSLADAGFIDTWLTTRLESGESSDMNNERRSVLDSFQGEQGATFDPLTNTLAAELVGSGLNNRPQRYDKILVKAHGHYHPHGFNMFGQTPFPSPREGHLTYPSDHWGIRCLLLKSTQTDASKSSAPEMKIELQRPVSSLVEGEHLEQFLENYGCLPTDQERATRAQAVKALEAALKDVSPSVAEGDARSGPEFVLVPAGSYGLGVWTSSSDIDCLCIGPFSSKTFFKLAIQRLKRAADIKILRRVKANSGHMLELEVHGIKADLQYCAAASIAERWPEVMKRPANDPAFALPFQTLAKLKPVRDLFYLRRSLPDMVLYRMAHLFIKSWAQERGIYSAKFGFLGGIHISVLLVPVCKALAHESETVSPTDIIVTFFRHYSQFDWKNSMVFDPFFHKDLRYNRTFREPLCLIGWHAPALNTAPIASVPTVTTIAAEFERANKLLSVDGCTWNGLLGLGSSQDAKRSRGATEFLHEFKTYIKVDAHYWGPSQEKSGRFIGWLESRCVMLLVDINRKLQQLVARIWPSRFLDTSSQGEESSGAEYHGCYLIGLAWDGKMSKENAKEMQTSVQTVLQDFETRIRRDEKYYESQFCWMSATVVRGSELGEMAVDTRPWGEFAGDTDDDEDSDDELEEDEELDNDEEEQKGKSSTVASHGSRAAVVGKAPGLGKFRTAADVLNRLRWDTNFDPSDYIIGYEDRFLGARERAVEQWKSEQTDEEFIPQHRILYFKRRADNAVVWERRTRVDDIFGSGIKKQTTDT